MTGLELERLARSVIPPVGATALVAVVDHEPGGRLVNGSPSGLGGRTRFGVAWQLFGRVTHSPAIALFDRQVDARRFLDILSGRDRAPRPGPDLAPALGTVEQGQAQAQAPVRADVLPSTPAVAAGPEPVAVMPAGTCAGCGGSLPPGRHGQRRLTCSAACRQRARRRAGAEPTPASTDSGPGFVTPSRPSTDPAPIEEADGDSSAVRRPLRRSSEPAESPVPGARVDDQLPLFGG